VVEIKKKGTLLEHFKRL